MIQGLLLNRQSAWDAVGTKCRVQSSLSFGFLKAYVFALICGITLWFFTFEKALLFLTLSGRGGGFCSGLLVQTNRLGLAESSHRKCAQLCWKGQGWQSPAWCVQRPSEVFAAAAKIGIIATSPLVRDTCRLKKHEWNGSSWSTTSNTRNRSTSTYTVRTLCIVLLSLSFPIRKKTTNHFFKECTENQPIHMYIRRSPWKPKEKLDKPSTTKTENPRPFALGGHDLRATIPTKLRSCQCGAIGVSGGTRYHLPPCSMALSPQKVG